MRSQYWSRSLFAGLCVVVAFAAVSCSPHEEVGSSPNIVASTADLASARTPVLPPNANAFGRPNAVWAQEWWKWAFSMPIDHHPLVDTAPCDTSQSGNVWFLGGSFVTGTPNPRTCKIPTGTALFFPLVNNECSTVEGNGTTAEALATCAKIQVTDVFCKIDGVPVDDAMKYELVSPLFTFGPLPDNNVLQTIFNVPAATEGVSSASVTYGVYLMLHPLTPGEHTLEFGGTIPAFNFSIDINYKLIVK